MKMKAWFLPVVASLGAGVVLAQETNLVSSPNLSSTSAVPPAASAAPAVPAVPVVPAAPAPAVSAPATLEAAPTNEVASATNAPKAKVVKKVKKAAPHILTHQLLEPTVPATVKVDNLNVRTQPSVDGDVITKLHKGETVTLLEDITVKGKKSEPTNWVRITLPANTPVWVSAHLISSNKTVTSTRINVRSGPGENCAVVGHLDKGAVVKDLRKHKEWLEIAAPADASAFVSADYLERSSSGPLASAPAVTPAPVGPASAPDTTPLPPPTTEVVTVAPDTNGSVMPAVDMPAPATTPAPETAVVPAPVVTAPTVELPKDEVLPKRIVNREGYLRKSLNIQAPADFELRDARTGELLDYISPLKSELDLKPYIGAKVIVSGEEAVDVRWKFIPLIKVETIDML